MIALSWNLAKDNGAIDFRNRVVAARVANLGINPYTFKWSSQYPEELLDPSDNAYRFYSRCTSPPTVLWVHSLFSAASYTVQKNGNFILAWLCFLFLFFASFRLAQSNTEKKVLGFCGLCMSAASFWFFHLERGQQYIYFSFLGMLSILSVCTGRQSMGALSAIPAAILASFRSSTGIMFGVGIFTNSRRYILICVATFLVMIGLSCAKFPTHYWASYTENVKDWTSEEHRPNLEAYKTPLPAAPEGIATLAAYKNFPEARKRLFSDLAGIKINPVFALVSTILVLGLSFFLIYRTRLKRSHLELGLLSWALVILADYLLPTPRAAYNDALWFPLVFLVAAHWERLRLPKIAKFLFLTSVLSAALVRFAPPIINALGKDAILLRVISKLFKKSMLAPDLFFPLFCLILVFSPGLFKERQDV